MPDDVAGSRAGDDAGAVFQRAATPDPYSEEGFTTYKGTLGELGQDKALEPIKDFQGAIKSLVEAQKMVGGSLRLPGKDLSPEDKGKAITELRPRLIEAGILEATPDTPEKYEITFPQEEGWAVNEALHTSFRKFAHSVNMSNSTAQKAFDWYVNFQAEAEAAEDSAFKAMKDGLKTEWGALYPRRMESARRVIAKHVGSDADDLISELPPAVGYKWLKAFSAIGDLLGVLEADFASGEPPTGLGNAEDIWKKMNEMMNDKASPLNNEGMAGRKEAIEEYNRLNQAYTLLKGGK